MTTSMLAFQQEADRYYAEGYWREGDLWSDFDARGQEHADRVALVLDDRRVTYAELRRAALAVSNRLADIRDQPRRRGDPARAPLDRGRGRDARLPASRRRAGAAAADVQRTADVSADRPDARERDRDLRRREGDRQVPLGGGRPPAAADRAAGGRRRRDRPGSPGRARAAARRRALPRPALVGHDFGAQGHRPLEQHTALRDRGRVHALGPDRRRHLSHRRRVRLRRRARLRVPARAAAGRHRGAAQPLGREGGTAPDRGPPLHLRPGDADARRRHDPRGRADRARPVLDARAGGTRPHAGAPDGDAPRVRHSAARRLRALRGSRPRGARARGPGGEDHAHRGPPLRPARRSGSSATTVSRCPRARSARSSSMGRAASWASSTTTTSRASH